MVLLRLFFFKLLLFQVVIMQETELWKSCVTPPSFGDMKKLICDSLTFYHSHQAGNTDPIQSLWGPGALQSCPNRRTCLINQQKICTHSYKKKEKGVISMGKSSSVFSGILKSKVFPLRKKAQSEIMLKIQNHLSKNIQYVHFVDMLYSYNWFEGENTPKFRVSTRHSTKYCLCVIVERFYMAYRKSIIKLCSFMYVGHVLTSVIPLKS